MKIYELIMFIRLFFTQRKKKGFGTVEIVLIIAVLISLALIFRTAITSYATDLITSVFGDQSLISESITGDGK